MQCRRRAHTHCYHREYDQDDDSCANSEASKKPREERIPGPGRLSDLNGRRVAIWRRLGLGLWTPKLEISWLPIPPVPPPEAVRRDGWPLSNRGDGRGRWLTWW